MKKYFLALAATVLAVSVLLGGCGRGGQAQSEETTTSFKELASYYDELAKGDIEVEVATTTIDKSYSFVGSRELLSGAVYEKLEYLVSNYYSRIYSKYGDSITRPTITVYIDTGYNRNDACYAIEKSIYLNPTWFENNPDDVESILSAIMGTIQSYDSDVPEWIETGIQSYVRAEFKSLYASKTWSIPSVYKGNSYEEGGIYAASFLRWINSQVEVDLIYRLHKMAQSGTYDESFWKTETGMSLGQLWSLYCSR